jgi:flagellar biosynthesis/type III secretory pathway protein FliH
MHRHKLTLTTRLAGISRAPGSEPHAACALATATPPGSSALAVPAHQPLLDAQALRHLAAELTNVVQEMRARDRQALDEIARLSVEVGTALAERLLNTEIAANRQRLDRIVAMALERMPTSRSIAVHGHPDDLALLERQWAEHLDPTRYRDVLVLRPDEACQRGQIKLETDELFIAWNTQRCLAELRAALLEQTYMDDEP